MLKKISLTIFALFLLLIIAFGARMFWLGQQSPSVVNSNLGVKEGHLNVCGDKPNCVSSTSQSESQFYIEPLASENIEGLWDDLNILVQDLIKDPKAYKIQNSEPGYLHLIAISKIFGFVDDMEFLFLPEQGVIEMRSESRVGYSDLGANRKRMEKFRSLLQPKK